MVKTIKEEKLKWVLPIAKKEVKLIDVTKVCPHGKRSLERWVAAYKAKGETRLDPNRKHIEGGQVPFSPIVLSQDA